MFLAPRFAVPSTTAIRAEKPLSNSSRYNDQKRHDFIHPCETVRFCSNILPPSPVLWILPPLFMSVRNYIAPFFIVGIIFTACDSKKSMTDDKTSFTKTDSLTELYLTLQDSLHDTWNMMITDDNKKIKCMKNLLHEVQIGGQFVAGDLQSYDQRVDQLCRIRYTAKTMWNADVVEEYDFASSSLVSELIALAESYTAYSYNTTLQKLVEEIRAADARVENYRADYDAVAGRYNQFIEENQNLLMEIADKETIDKKPLFQVAAD
jgi:hypothetical protein